MLTNEGLTEKVGKSLASQAQQSFYKCLLVVNDGQNTLLVREAARH